MRQWEYKIEYLCNEITEKELDKLGLLRWELIIFYLRKDGLFVYIFKRELNGKL
jgi:cytochrome c oxidase subunit IV